MKKMFYFLALIGCICTAFAEAKPKEDALKFDVIQKDYMFSTVFEFNSPDDFLGSVVKSVFRIRTNYDLYDKNGNYESVGICRILTLGVLYAWGTEVDVYDPNDAYLGMIDGQVVTGAGAKFSIYNGAAERVGIAYLDWGNSGFTIVDPDNESRHIASLKRNFIEGVIDTWSVAVYDRKAIDLRLIKTFAAFAVDSQEHFAEDK